jgi:hypothetical protein
MDEERPAFLITACIILMIAVGLAVIHGLAPKRAPFVWPVANCAKPLIALDRDGDLTVVWVGGPCMHIPRQQDI